VTKKSCKSPYTEIKQSKNGKQNTNASPNQQGKGCVQNHSSVSTFRMMEARKLGENTTLTVAETMYFRGFPRAFLIFVI